MGLEIFNITEKDINFYFEYVNEIRKNKSVRAGQICRISKNISHDTGYAGEICIIEDPTDMQDYCYMFAYDNRNQRYWPCGIDINDIDILDYSMSDLSETFKESIKSYFLQNKFQICSREFADAYNKHFNITKKQKPPIGIEPHKFWVESRISDIWKAIERYVSTNTKVPVEWIEEYNKLVDEIK